jgi:hypothetical protein
MKMARTFLLTPKEKHKKLKKLPINLEVLMILKVAIYGFQRAVDMIEKYK